MGLVILLTKVQPERAAIYKGKKIALYTLVDDSKYRCKCEDEVTVMNYRDLDIEQVEHQRLDYAKPEERLDFELPAGLEANEPPEARGLKRDQVRLMVSYRHSQEVLHTQFRNLPDF